MSTETAPSAADLVVIGAGPGGYVAAIRAAQCGLETVLVERGEPGGVCLNHGCIPSKALIEAARHAGSDDQVAELGVERTSELAFDDFAAWQDSVVSRLTGGVQSLCRSNGVTLVEGRGRSSTTRRSRSSQTTSRPTPRPSPSTTPSSRPGADRWRFRASTTPRTTCSVRGTSSTSRAPGPPRRRRRGLHRDGALDSVRAPGTDVQVLEALDAPLPGYDEETVDIVRERTEELGVSFSFGEAAAEWYEDITGDVTVVTETEDGEASETPQADGERSEYVGEHVLVAVGRVPVTDTVDLDAAGVETDDRGFVETDEYGRTDAEHIYAIGDVAGDPMLAHAASHEGMRAAEHAAGRDPGGDADQPIPAVVFTDPEIASVGMTEEEAVEADYDVTVGQVPFRSNGRALTTGEASGFCRVVVDADSGTVLGGQLVGPHVSELVGELTLAVTAGLDAETVAHTVHAHPTPRSV